MKRPTIRSITARQLVTLASVALALPISSAVASGQGASPGKPLVSTAGATRVKPPTAVLQGSVDPHALATTYYFEYGPTVAYGSRTATGTLAAGTARVKVSEPVSGIQLGYHYRLVASNADGAREGRDHTISSSNGTGKKHQDAIVLPSVFHATPLGGAFVLSGALTGPAHANRSVVLQASPYPYRTAYADVGAPILTTSTGHFSFRVAKLTTNTKFRVATVTAKPVYSAVVPELVTVRVLLKVRSSRSAPGLDRLYGTVTPAEVGARVFVQLEKPPKNKEEQASRGEQLIRPENTKKSGKSKRGGRAENSEKLPTFLTEFTTVAKHGTRGISRFSTVVKIPTTGHYRVFVLLKPGALASGHSQTIYLHAAPGSKNTKHKRKRHKK